MPTATPANVHAASTEAAGANGELLLLEAARSLVHDTRNRLTGLSLFLAALQTNAGKLANLSRSDLALLEKSLGAIEMLCGEFSEIETAMYTREASDTDSIAPWYSSYLARLGIPASMRCDTEGVGLTGARRGVLCRALIELATVLLRYRACEVSLSVEAPAGAYQFALGFRAVVAREHVEADRTVISLTHLLEKSGGQMQLTGEKNRTFITILFADLSYAAMK